MKHRNVGIRDPIAPPAESLAYATVGSLAMLERAARDFSLLPRQPVRSLLAGRNGSKLRGRGLTFEELRQYFPGDDIRAMDWRVTARTGKAFVRVYTEEKDRPALFLIDQRINMFFGSKRAMKSVTAAEVGALGAWCALAQGDRIGGFVFNDDRIDDLYPYRSRQAVMRFIEAISVQNSALRADGGARRNPAQLNAVLKRVARAAKHDRLVVIASDFDGHDALTRDLLLELAVHNDVIVVVVYDPFLLRLPKSGELVVSDGELQVEMEVGGERLRKGIAEFADARAKALLAWQRETGVPVLPVSAAEETAPQLRRLLGQPLPRRRAH
jgi:uncharacterized protein (DUF58 family)